MPETTVRPSVIEKLFKAYRTPTADDIAGSMYKAQEAFGLWRTVPVSYRVKYLAALRRTIVNSTQEIVRHIAKATGKVATEALMTDVFPTLELVKYYENNAAAILAPQRVRTPVYFRNTSSYVRYEPLGVVLVISPWNYPFQLSMVPLVSALVAGNAVILKPSEATPSIGELVNLVCRRAALPANLVQVLYGGGDTARRLIEARPDKIFFTGSTATGRKVMEQAARELIPVALELSSKDPMIVFEDASLERAVDGAAYGAFANAGQSCVAVERLYVQDTIYEIFLKLLAQRSKELRVGEGPDADIGSLACREQLTVVKEHVRDALNKGAKNITEIREEGLYFYPVVLKDVTHDMKIMREETFGPVLPVMPFHSEDDAVRLANDSPYGLDASVWTGDLEKGRRVAAKLDAGNCCINDVVKNIGNPYLPFGGIKKSGFGRYRGQTGLYAFSNGKSVMVNAGNTAKEINWFPFSQDLYNSISTFINLRYSDLPLMTRLKGIRKALRFINTRERLW